MSNLGGMAKAPPPTEDWQIELNTISKYGEKGILFLVYCSWYSEDKDVLLYMISTVLLHATKVVLILLGSISHMRIRRRKSIFALM